MQISQGDIILIPFPFTNLKSTKVRPALAIHAYSRYEDVILLGITSQKSGKKEVFFDNMHLSNGQIPIKSYIRYNKVATLHRSLIRKVVAKLNKSKLQETIREFKRQF